MSRYNEFYSAIDEIKGFLHRDLIGPIEANEVIESIEPLGYYAMGILWPKRLGDGSGYVASQLSVFDEYDDEIEDYIHTEDDSITSANAYKPSAMGISVMIPGVAKNLNAPFSFGKYTMSSVEQPPKEEGKKPITINYFTRKEYSLSPTFAVPARLGTVACNEYNDCHNVGADITLCVRKILADGSKLVTISVINAVSAPQRAKEQNENALFQCSLSINCDNGFIPIYQNTLSTNSSEEQISAMQYRDVQNYAYGHGCSVSYTDSERITEISSEFMPSERVLQMMPGVIKANNILRLKYWHNADRASACDILDRFISEYGEWRIKQSTLAKSLGSESRNAADVVLSDIDVCISRLKHGVSVLRTDDNAWSAFKLMNEAMLLQRAKSKKLKEFELDGVEWYPFQIAYILQIIPDITDVKSQYRDNVDLLWFPTGGGKTEAYLGVAAFVIFYRRLAAKLQSDGVTIIMRYTLRLLTIQQFERASALICSCEHLRSVYRIPGGEINIGLWIGSGMTPNHIDGEGGAAEKLKELNDNPDKKIYEGNPVQITTCPWCGESIDLEGYSIDKDTGMTIRCNRNPKCEFHSSLPIYVIDDDIYRVQPTLVLSTIDKFARLAWEERSKSLFGNNKCAPPELIIQDELHLISGPLGSLAGIYEIGVEYLCNQNGRYPKMIASTATVKNAAEQIKNLYNKPMRQFPPSGISYTDSFFAVRASENDKPARTYIGLCETGGTLADLMIRVYANLVFVKHLFIKQGESDYVIDQFSTIIGYFNAIKDLGSASNIIFDRVYSIIRTLTNLKFKSDAEKVGLTLSDIKTGNNDELTSRKTSKEVKETLNNLELPYTEHGSYSYVLASNMLSVGIDINRLGVMTMYNQPKSNAEYIQATSRVGRQNPGVVLTMYNASRSRDKSHYEQFGFYHKSFYQYVESTSVTPFSARAIEKAIHCIFMIMLRLTEPLLSSNNSAVNFRAGDPCVGKVKRFILERIQKINQDAVSGAEQYITDIAELWEKLAVENPVTLVYFKRNAESVCNLLISGEQGSVLDFPATLNSLRNVEPSCNVFIQERDL